LEVAKSKIEGFCAYQERSHLEVKNKLESWHIDFRDINRLISELIETNFLNEERFASSYVSGKFRIKKWGKIKIRQQLKSKQVSNYSLNKALAEIDEDDYLSTLTKLAISKNRLIKAKDQWDRRIKLQRFLQSKGYENELIGEVLSDFLQHE
jgi:regulatory protein